MVELDKRDSFGYAKTVKVRFSLLDEGCGSRNKATGCKQLPRARAESHPIHPSHLTSAISEVQSGSR